MATISVFRNEVAPNALGASSPASPTIGIRPTSAPRPDTADARLVAVLDAPLGLGETTLAGYARKEHELGAIFASLSWQESRAMHLRLTNAKAGDELASKFARLTIERRVRLLNFLADARRRAACAAGRR
ncbi:MAG: hypothetical protein H0T46_09680 [Deltaproteobacteria bacterium]|nr:hypothetical protein [Deltaproteobacteria bacterium]